RLPAVYPERPFVVAGGLIFYGLDYAGQFRQAGGYVDRILKGEKPANLPVQNPTKYALVINPKTARALRITFPISLLGGAADAEAICEAVGRPTMRFVPVKTADQQAAVLLHRGRERLVRQRTGLVNALRGHLAEFGVIAPQGLRNVGKLIAIVRD